MCTNFARSVANKCLLAIKSHNSQQVRLESYRAAFLKETGKPLVIEQVEKINKLDKNQIRVQVNYCSVNTTDVVAFKDKNIKPNYIPGHELSGEVLEVGSNVKANIVTVGERVAVLAHNRGGFAEQCVVESKDVWRLPTNVNRKDAAVLIFGHSNAIYAFSHLSLLKEQAKIIISAGPAGLGLAAIDVAANVYKTKPIGVCDNEDMAALVRDRGAFKTTTFAHKKLEKELSSADVVYDAVGGDIHGKLSKCAKADGIIFYAAPTPPCFEKYCRTAEKSKTNIVLVNFEDLREKNIELYRTLVSDTLEMADQGIISAHVSAKFELKDVNEAIKYIEDNKCTGKVVIHMLD